VSIRPKRALLPDRALVGAWLFAVVCWCAAALVLVTPWPFSTSMRHFAAAFGCDAARAVGLAPAKRNEPGYWPWLDRDARGTACAAPSLHGTATPRTSWP